VGGSMKGVDCFLMTATASLISNEILVQIRL
jgi:hypothetical protein